MVPTMTRALLLLCLAALPAFSQVNIVVGPNVNVTKRNGNENETAIVINRANPNNLVIVSNYDGANMLKAVSNNGGTSWTTSDATFGSSSSVCCDGYLGSDSFGNIFVSYLNSGTGVSRSVDGGANFTALTTIAGSTDHPEMGVGPGGAAGSSSVWIRHTSSGSRAFGAQSTALGSTSAFTAQQTTAGGNFGSIAVGTGGRVATTHMTTSSGAGPSNMPIYYNAGGTAAPAFTLMSTLTTNVGGFRFIPAQINRSIDTQVHLQYDWSGGDRNGNLYIVYTQAANTTTNDTNIVFRRSTNNGTSWTAETRINQDVGTTSQFFSRLAVDQTTGNLAAVWMDARNDTVTNKFVELWGSVSTDGGTTWGTNFKISTGRWDGTGQNTGDGNDMGDYIGIDFYNGVLVASWPDASNSTGDNPNGTTRLDLMYAKVTVTPIPEPAGVLAAAVGAGLLVRRFRRFPLANAAPPG